MIEIKPPGDYGLDRNESLPALFLAGTIDMGNSRNWQNEVVQSFKNYDVAIFNPRRDNWDSSWEQKITNPIFSQQVEWEVQHLWSSRYVLFNFEETSMSPISLLELGICVARRASTTVVCCPQGFYRKGNVDIVCRNYRVPVYEHLEGAVTLVKQWLKK